VLVSREDVGEVCAVDDVFQSGKNTDPDVRAVVVRDKSSNVSMNISLWNLRAQRTYRLQKKYSSHTQMGAEGRKNWRVAGVSESHELAIMAKHFSRGAEGAT
jgi:hypothetical protein